MTENPQEKSTADSMDYLSKKSKSELYHIWKKARSLFEKIASDNDVEDWVKKNIMQAHDLIDEASRWIEYQELLPERKQEEIPRPLRSFSVQEPIECHPQPP